MTSDLNHAVGAAEINSQMGRMETVAGRTKTTAVAAPFLTPRVCVRVFFVPECRRASKYRYSPTTARHAMSSNVSVGSDTVNRCESPNRKPPCEKSCSSDRVRITAPGSRKQTCHTMPVFGVRRDVALRRAQTHAADR